MPAKPTTPESENLQEQTRLVRIIEAALKVAVPDPEELRFRRSLLACATAQLADLKPPFVVRLYEAACDVKFPSDEVTSFRKSLQRTIGRSLSLKQYSQPATT
jgi:hypothetical protein